MEQPTSPGFNGIIAGKIFHKADSVTISINFSVAKAGSSSNGPTIGVRDVTVLQKYAHNDDFEGLYITTSDITILKHTGCDRGKFLAAGGSCQSCPTSICDNCVGLGGNNCIKANWAKYFDGNSFSSCVSGCSVCTGPNANDCVQCDSSLILDTDNTCKIGCTLPYVSSGTFFYSRCRLPCNSQFSIFTGITLAETHATIHYKLT